MVADFILSCKYILASHCFENLQKQKAKSLDKENWIILAREMGVSPGVVMGED